MLRILKEHNIEKMCVCENMIKKLYPLEKIIKVKINPEQRKAFPELALDLEFHGVLLDVLVDDLGVIHDGIKRTLLLGLEQIKALGKYQLVERDSYCSNIPANSLTKNQKQLLIIESHKMVFPQDGEQLQTHDKDGCDRGTENHAFVKEYAKRYNVSQRTIYRWLLPKYLEELDQRKAEKKAKAELNKKYKEEMEKIRDAPMREYQIQEDKKKAEQQKIDDAIIVVRATHSEEIASLDNWLLDIKEGRFTLTDSERLELMSLRENLIALNLGEFQE